jgi:hypothetical protein
MRLRKRRRSKLGILESDGHAGLKSSVPRTLGVLLGDSMALMERVCAEAFGRIKGR